MRKIGAQNGLPTYEHVNDLETQGTSQEIFKGKEYSMSSSLRKRKFVLFNGVYIRKTTALYLVQENTQLLADGLLRVRATQPDHFYDNRKSVFRARMNFSCDLCLFQRVDCNQCLIWRVVQFSYLTGNKNRGNFLCGLI